jgi:hypothetical protein
MAGVGCQDGRQNKNRRIDMNGDDLARRIGNLRADGRRLSKLSLLWKHKRTSSGTTAADCARIARDPLRRLEPLRRRTATTR